MKIKVVADNSHDNRHSHNIPIGTQLDVEYKAEGAVMVVYKGEDICLFEDEYQEIK